MAEIRKHKPSSNPITQALVAAMGEPIRPVTPGSRPAGAEKDDERPEAAGPARLGAVPGWQGFTVSAAPPMGGSTGRQAAAAGMDEEDGGDDTESAEGAGD